MLSYYFPPAFQQKQPPTSPTLCKPYARNLQPTHPRRLPPPPPFQRKHHKESPTTCEEPENTAGKGLEAWRKVQADRKGIEQLEKQ